jgi:hypothetical protein
MDKDEMKNRISMALKDPTLQQCFEIICKNLEELEKENAELKSRDCWKSCEYANPKAELIGQHIKDVQNLTKAKEIIRDLINLTEPISTEEVQHWNETFRKAEKFLSEVEK